MTVFGRGREKHRKGRIGVEEAGDKFGSDFIGARRNGRAQNGVYSSALGSQGLHAVKGRFQNAGKGTFPARMAGADHPRFGIGKQHWATIGGGNGQTQAGPVCHHAVGFGTLVTRPRCGDGHHIGRMDLPA